MKIDILGNHYSIFTSVLMVLICLSPLLLSCSAGKEVNVVEEEATPPTRAEHPGTRQEENITEKEIDLWTLTNPKSSFSVFLTPNDLEYQIDDYLTLRVHTTQEAHLIILNWDATETLNLLIPNAYQQSNVVPAGGHRDYPTAGSEFNFRLGGPPGLERIKTIATRSAADSRAITAFFPLNKGGFQHVTGLRRQNVEKKIATYLQGIEPAVWAEDTQILEVKPASDSD